MRLVGIALCALAVLALSCSRTSKTCAVCQRDECTGMAFRVISSDDKQVETCCPRCGMHYLETAKQPVGSVQATDYTTGKWMDAKMATYVSGSDVSHCSSKEIKRDAQGCCYVKGFDRCLPSVIAFQTQDDAEKFQKEHGGKIVPFEKLAAN